MYELRTVLIIIFSTVVLLLAFPLLWIAANVAYEEGAGFLERRAIRPNFEAIANVTLLELTGNPDDGIRATIVVSGDDKIGLSYLSTESFAHPDHLNLESMNGLALWGKSCTGWIVGADVGSRGNTFFASLRIKNIQDLVDRRGELKTIFAAIPRCPKATDGTGFNGSLVRYCVGPAEESFNTRSPLWPRLECPAPR